MRLAFLRAQHSRLRTHRALKLILTGLLIAPGVALSQVPSLLDFAVYGTGTGCAALRFTDRVSVDSFDSSNGPYSETRQPGQGIVGTSGNLSLSGNAAINGPAFVLDTRRGPCSNGGPGVTIEDQPQVTGGYFRLTSAPSFPNPPPVVPGTKNVESSGALVPGSYGNIVLSDKATLTLSPGTYNVNSISLADNAVLTISPQGQVILNVAGVNVSQAIHVSDYGQINMAASSSGKPANLLLIYGGSLPLAFADQSMASALLYAPNATAHFSDGSNWYGSLVVRTLEAEGGAAFHYDRSLAAPPTITGMASPPPDAAGWNNSNVTVTFTCLDAILGIASCTTPVTLTTEGSNQIVSGTAVNRAGFSASTSVTVNIDETPPIISGGASPPPNAAGWNNTNVTVTFLCADALSGIASCPLPVIVSAEGAGQIVRGTAVDKAGNTASAATTVNLDKTPPSITATVSPAPNAAGWNTTNVTVTFTCSDALSGIDICPAAMQVTADGAGQVISGTARDRAGNTTTASVTVNLDKTPPAITGAVAPSPNAAGWNNSSVTVTFACSDATSGIASCSAPAMLSGEGANQTVNGTAADRAGNTANTSVTVNIDKTAPTITATAAPAPNAAGWNNTTVTITFSCADSLSGVATCPGPSAVTADGAGQTVAGTAFDKAGNTATTSATVNIDKTPPTITATISPAPNAAGWNNTTVTVTFVCSDAGSGVATCPAPVQVTTEGTGQVVSGTALDKAGNSASVSVTVNIDLTAPGITVTSTPAPNAAGWNNTNVTVTFTCSDALSGVAVCPVANVVSTEGASQPISGTATDKAGNTASTTASISLDKTPPTITATVSPAPNAAGWNNGSVTVSFTCSDALSGVASCPTPVVVTTEGAGQVFSGTAIDRAGNTTSASVTINVDMTVPMITGAIGPPANAAGWNNANVTATFTCTDALSGVAACSGPEAFTAEGQNQTATGTVTDKAGNTATATIPINLDKTPPLLTILSPVSGTQANPGPINVTGAVTDALSGVAGVTCQGTPATISGTNFSCTVTIAQGPNSIGVQATDLAGNPTQASVSVQGGIPAILTATPNTGQQGQQNLTVNLTGQFTHWVQGTTTASFGAGITVASLTVNSPTSATAVLNINRTILPPTGNFGQAAAGYAVTNFVTGLTHNAVNGPVGLAFDGSGELYVMNYVDGFLYKFGAAGGTPSAATQVNATPIPGGQPDSLSTKTVTSTLLVRPQTM